MKKYCPNCLGECNEFEGIKNHIAEISKGYGCNKCGIIVYSNEVLLDNPDEIEKSQKYRLRQVLKFDDINLVYEDLKNIFKL